MKRIKTFLIPIILSNPFQVYSRNIIDEYSSINLNVATNFEEIVHSRKNNLMQPILVNADKDYVDIDEENDIQLTSGIKDNLFPKLGSSYREQTNSRGKRHSQVESTLIFRQSTESKNGQKKPYKGSSSAIHPENLANFEKAGIPIDPMKDPRKKPDRHNKWCWDKEKKGWKLVSEHKILIEGTNKILTESEWNDMVRNSKKI
nr:hypothetical protein [Gracilaria tikvahiae]